MSAGYQARLQEYLRQRLPELESLTVADMSLIAQGASNETYRLRLEYTHAGKRSAGHYVLRPQRAAGILEPYDISRQYRVMEALQGTAVPVPRLVCLEEADDVLGTPFFLTEYVDADSLPLPWEAGEPHTASHARALRRIHEVDWRGQGLTFLANPADAPAAIDQEIDAWLARARRHGDKVHALLASLAEWLRRHNPGRGDAVLIHGDPNPGNYLFKGTEVVAVVDWELAAISDPRSDLGFYAAIQTLVGGIVGAATDLGFISAYEEASATEVEDMDYFEALGLFKMASVALGAERWAALRPYLEQVLYARVDEICGPAPGA